MNNRRGDPEVFQTIWKHLKSDGMPDQAANQLTAEMLTHGEDVDSSIEKYERYYDNFRERGYNETRCPSYGCRSFRRWRGSNREP